jgi:hypothetical protein
MAHIDVQQTQANDDGFEFAVTVDEAGDSSRHQVTLTAPDYERWGANSDSPEAFVTRCFEFLLEREPKASILSRFDVSQIRSYFPEFDEQMRRLVG